MNGGALSAPGGSGKGPGEWRRAGRLQASAPRGAACRKHPEGHRCAGGEKPGGAGRGRTGQRRPRCACQAAAAHLPAGAGRGAALGRARPPPPASRPPPGEEAEGRGVNRATAVMSAGHMEPLMARDGSRRAGSCGSCCCGSGGGGAAATEGAPGSDYPPSLRSPHRGLNDVFCDRSDER